ncbi:MAG: SCO family protein [Planctomycetota bacterium]|nr:SCO family protein [Planctomycetota bacterium]
MSKPQKILAIALWIVAVVAMVGVLLLKTMSTGRNSSVAAARGGSDIPGQILPEPLAASAKDLPTLYDAPRFDLTNQDGQPFGNAQLQSHPWIADFIFTTCASQCPIISSRMAGLQQQLPKEIKLVSFTVDPSHDTPAALTLYAAQYKADLKRWSFLTGDPPAVLAVIAGMKMGFQPADNGTSIIHSPYMVLVDGQGHVRGVYDSGSESKMTQLAHDASLLLSAATSP